MGRGHSLDTQGRSAAVRGLQQESQENPYRASWEQHHVTRLARRRRGGPSATEPRVCKGQGLVFVWSPNAVPAECSFTIEGRNAHYHWHQPIPYQGNFYMLKVSFLSNRVRQEMGHSGVLDGWGRFVAFAFSEL